ncbi:MAG: glycoside hydrolase family 20 zincin-like fold domain-containing protein [Myxococcota bacterium]
MRAQKKVRSRGHSLPPLLPRPQRVRARTSRFLLQSDTPIVLMDEGGEIALITAERLQTGLAARCGVRTKIERHVRSHDLGPCIRLEMDGQLETDREEAIRQQSYRIEIDARGVRLRGGGPAGLRYAIETLLGLVDSRGHLAGCRIDDAPDLAMRGIMLDISRGKVPTRESLESLVDLCVRLKLNLLMLYTEHTFRFRRHPEIGRNDSPLDSETLSRLDRYAKERHVQLVPCLQSLGHMEHILKLPKYRALSETERGWALAPVDPKTYTLLSDLYDEYLPNFESGYFNANCDEPWDLGQGRSKRRSDRLGPGGLYLEHVERVRELAKDHGKRTMIWADFIHAHPERIPEIHPDLILLDWWYEAQFEYDRVAVFAENDLKFMVCPGTSSWNSLFPRVQNSVLNISRWADAARRHGAMGLLNTDWGDGGHYNLQGNSLFAYAWGAQEAWSGSPEARAFDRAFSTSLFGETSGAVARLYRALGALHDPGFAMFNGSPLQYLFFDSIESAYFVRASKPARLDRLVGQLERLRPRILGAQERSQKGHLALDEMLYALDASLFAVQKAQAGHDYLSWRNEPATWSASDRRALARRFELLAEDQRSLGRRLEKLWLERARVSNLDVTLRRLRRSARQLQAAARRLRKGKPTRPPKPEVFSVRRAMEAARENT